MDIGGIHVLAVIPPDHTVGIVFGIVFLLCALVLAYATFDSFVWVQYGAGILFGVLTVLAAVMSYIAFNYYTPQQYKVTISDMSHFDYKHWRIVDQEGEILTVEKVNP
jgi:glucan phosphoethanolaminetransferase (alkaline phosphatase superfamily)